MIKYMGNEAETDAMVGRSNSARWGWWEDV
jgi:hypothetical protein